MAQPTEAQREAARVIKALNLDTAREGAKREALVVSRICQLMPCPAVVFRQGFAAGEDGAVEGLATDHGIEPSLADYRIGRIGAESSVHLEISGSDAWIRGGDWLYVRIEKVRQQQRTGDNKLYALHYSSYGRQERLFYIRFPEGAIDLLGSLTDIRARYAGRADLDFRRIKGQAMVGIRPNSPYVLSEAAALGHIAQSLKSPLLAELSPVECEADRRFHEDLQADEEACERITADYLADRAKWTLNKHEALELDEATRQKLAKRGALKGMIHLAWLNALGYIQ